jgi:hypothetical protein
VVLIAPNFVSNGVTCHGSEENRFDVASSALATGAALAERGGAGANHGFCDGTMARPPAKDPEEEQVTS